MASGIYRITHTPSGDTYVGSAVNIHRRWNQHRYCLRREMHGSRKLQALWSRDGEDFFEFGILEDGVQQQDLCYREKHWIASLQPVLNTIEPFTPPMLGRKHSEESRKKIRESRKGQVFSEEARKRMGDSHRGKKHPPRSPETIRRLSESHKGKPSPEKSGCCH